MTNPKHNALSKKLTMADIKKSAIKHGVHKDSPKINPKNWPSTGKNYLKTDKQKREYQERNGRAWND